MNILVSGLVNTETTAQVRGFPIPYYPIDYPFFGVNTAVSGVGFNLAKAMKTLGDQVCLRSMTGDDFSASFIRHTLQCEGIDYSGVLPRVRQTASSVVLYDPEGKRQIYCDLKDIQETAYPFSPADLDGIDLVVACNINFNRALLPLAKAAGKTIATDVHVLSDIHDPYNREFMEAADILFLSDEGIGDDYRGFIAELGRIYRNRIIVLGRGSKGAALYLPAEGQFHELPAVQVGPVVNTVGAGDALFSSFLQGYVKGLSPVDALQRAQLFASSKIRTSGAARGFIAEDELESLYLQKK
jgi:ribokinase